MRHNTNAYQETLISDYNSVANMGSDLCLIYIHKGREDMYNSPQLY